MNINELINLINNTDNIFIRFAHSILIIGTISLLSIIMLVIIEWLLLSTNRHSGVSIKKSTEFHDNISISINLVGIILTTIIIAYFITLIVSLII